MPKRFKKGDPVRIKKWEDVSKVDAFVDRMKPLCGKPAVIIDRDDRAYRLRPMQIADMALDWDWWFTDEMLEKL